MAKATARPLSHPRSISCSPVAEAVVGQADLLADQAGIALVFVERGGLQAARKG